MPWVRAFRGVASATPKAVCLLNAPALYLWERGDREAAGEGLARRRCMETERPFDARLSKFVPGGATPFEKR